MVRRCVNLKVELERDFVFKLWYPLPLKLLWILIHFSCATTVISTERHKYGQTTM